VCDLVQKLDGLPLAIELAAARLDILSLEEVASHLNERFSLLCSRGRDAQALEGALDWSWDLLEPWAKAALSQASVFRGGLDLEAAERVIEVGEHKDCPALFDILGELVDNSLLRKDQASDGSVRYGLLESIRAYAADKLAGTGEVDPALRIASAVAAVQGRHAACFARFGDPTRLSALDSFDSFAHWVALFSELDNLVAAIGHGDSETAPLCCLAALKVLGMKGPVSLGVEIANQVLELPGLSRRLRMQLEIERSKCLRISGRMSEARAVVGSTEKASPEEARLEAKRLEELGLIELEQSNFSEAERCFGAALDLFRRARDRKGEGRVLGHLGDICRNQAQHERAIELFTEAIAIHREVGARHYETVNLGNLGDALVELGRFGEGEASLRQAIALGDLRYAVAAGAFRGSLALLLARQGQCEETTALLEIGEAQIVSVPEEYAKFLCKKGHVMQIAGKPEAARASLNRAIEIKAELKSGEDGEVGSAIRKLENRLESEGSKGSEAEGAPASPNQSQGNVEEQELTENDEGELALMEACRLEELGNIEFDQSNHDEGLKCWLAALAINRKHGHRRGVGVNLLNLGNFYRRQGKVELATETLREAFAIHVELGDCRHQGHALANLALVFLRSGKHDLAIDHFQRALSLLTEVGDTRHRGIHLSNLALVYIARGELHTAIQHLSQALRLHREVENKPAEGYALGSLGQVYLVQGQFEASLEHYQRALDIHREVGNRRSEGIVLGNMGDAFIESERSNEARERLVAAIQILDERFPVAAGAFRGSLATVFARSDQLEDAQALLALGEPQVQEVPEEYAKFLCKKGRVQHLAGQAEAAKASLDQAQGIAADLGFSEDSEVMRAVRSTTELLGEGGLPGSDKDLGEEVEQATLEADRWVELGNVEHSQANLVEASECYRAAFEISHKHRYRKGEGAALLGLALVHRDQGSFDEAIAQFDRAIEIHIECGNRRLEGTGLGNLGTVHHKLGNLEEAIDYYERAIEIHREIGNRRDEGTVLGTLGLAYRTLGRLDEAIGQFRCALRIHREIGNRRSEAIVLGNLGSAHIAQGELDDALEHLELAIHICREIGSEQSEGIHWGNKGEVFVQLDRLDEAREAFLRAIEACDHTFPSVAGHFRGSLALLLARQGQIEDAKELLEIGEAQVETYPDEYGKFLCKKGQVEKLSGQLEAARKSLEQARGIAARMKLTEHSEVARAIEELAGLLDDSGLDDGQEESDSGFDLVVIEANQLLALGHVEREEANYSEAERCYRAAAEIYRDREIRTSEASALVDLGNLARDQGKIDDAKSFYEPALQIYRELGEEYGMGISLGGLGLIHRTRGKLDRAMEFFQEALVFHRKIGNRRSEGITLGNMGLVYIDQGKLDEAADHFEQAIWISREIGDQKCAGIYMGSRGQVFAIQGRLEEALAEYHRSVDIHRRTGDVRSEGISLGNLGDVLARLGREEQAEECLRDAIAICEGAVPPAAGAFRGTLALLLAEKGQLDEAQALLETGESLLQSHIGEYGIFLCKKGRVQCLSGQAQAARESLKQAQQVGKEASVGENSELARAIEALVLVLGSDGELSEEAGLELLEAERLLRLGRIELE
jgi:tetratricopeptide (TPR) repeat protein